MKKTFISKVTTVLLIGAIPFTLCIKDKTVTAQNLSKNFVELDKLMEDVLRDQFKEDNIPSEIQDNLIQKKRNGELWDAEKEEKLKEIPIDYFTFTFDEIADKTYSFSDGSYVRMIGDSVESINLYERMNRRSPYERNIPRLNVQARYGGTRVGIYANVSMYYGGSSRINSVEPTGVVYAVNGRLASDPSPYIAKQNGTTYSPAIAVYAPKFTRDTAFGSGKTFTAEYNLRVNGVGYSATLNQY